MFSALGALIHRRRWATLAIAGLFLTLALVALVRGGRLSAGTIDGLEATRADALVAGVVGRSADTTFVVLVRPTSLDAGAPDVEAAAEAMLAPLRADEAVASVLSTRDVDPRLAAAWRSDEDGVVLALVTLRGELVDALAAYPSVRARLTSPALEVTTTGRVPFMNDLNVALEADLLRAELLSLPLALLVLLLVFRTAVAAALPIGVGALAVVGGIAMLFALSHATAISQYAINVCSLIGLGVAIDYSLFTVARYREELALGHDHQPALVRALGHSGKVVVFSAAAVGLGLGGLMFFPGSYLRTMGVGGAIVVALAALFALTFLPALLAVLGPNISRLALPLPKLTLREGLWHRLSQWVMRRPAQVLVPTLAVLLLLGSPALHMQLAPSDVSVLPETQEARRGFALLKTHFPDEADTHFNVAVEFPPGPVLTGARVQALYELSARLAAMPAVRAVRSLTWGDPRLDGAGYQALLLDPPPQAAAAIAGATAAFSRDSVVFLQAISASVPESEEARAVVRAIRAQRKVADGTLVVGGESALDVDTTHYLATWMPWAVGFVVLSTLVVLVVLLGSVLLPVKAVLMNCLSLGGAFGALVFIFQDGHGLSGPGRALEPALPVLLFCVLFGLSMDYEVLILSRMKEAWDRTGDNRLAVGEGLEKTGGLVTSAAAIMVAVFLSFATADVVLIKAIGVGMAVAVALDATLVRVLLVPATMRLFGDANWWAPRWVHELRRRLGLAEGGGRVDPSNLELRDAPE